jgi:hypothetical protein
MPTILMHFIPCTISVVETLQLQTGLPSSVVSQVSFSAIRDFGNSTRYPHSIVGGPSRDNFPRLFPCSILPLESMLIISRRTDVEGGSELTVGNGAGLLRCFKSVKQAR